MYIGILLAAHYILHISRIRVKYTLFLIMQDCASFRGLCDNISKNDGINSKLFRREKLLLYVTLTVIIAC